MIDKNGMQGQSIKMTSFISYPLRSIIWLEYYSWVSIMSAEDNPEVDEWLEGQTFLEDGEAKMRCLI